MGYPNFAQILDALVDETVEVNNLDPNLIRCILVDAISLLYNRFEYGPDVDNDCNKRTSDLAANVLREIGQILDKIFALASKHNGPDLTGNTSFFNIVICFDGRGMKMKIPAKRERRIHISNEIDRTMRQRIIHEIRRLAPTHEAIVRIFNGKCKISVDEAADADGEGEQKAALYARLCEEFHKENCGIPLIISFDSDAWAIAMTRFAFTKKSLLVGLLDRQDS